ncbi:hypothetical protein VTL71DRAFT_6690 [Oculimacula yallundae]|uniref:2EXR domain-containing protein n=1 Tax=Oculimacula yallundae TaxID=86028 RepID=A0ABR4BXL7_9HELO
MSMNPATEPVGERGAFTLFGKLPIEVQYMIWEKSLPGSRIVYLEAEYIDLDWNSRAMSRKRFRILRDLDREFGHDEDDEDENHMPIMKNDERKLATSSPRYTRHSALNPFKFTSPSTQTLLPIILPLLLCCYASRQVVLRRYTKTFSTPFHPAETYFSFKHDTLYLDWGCMSEGKSADKEFTPEDFKPREAERVKNLMLNDGYDMQGPIEKLSPRFERNRYMRWLQRNVLPVFRSLDILGTMSKQHGDTDQELRDLTCMRGVWDVDGAIRLFSHDRAQQSHARYYRRFLKANSALGEHVRANAPLRLTRHRRLPRQTSRELRPSVTYLIPRVCGYGTILTQQRWNQLFQAKVRFDALKEGWNADVWLRYLGSGLRPIRVTVESHVTMRTLIDAFGVLLDVPESLRLNEAQWKRNMDRTLYELELERGQHVVRDLVVNNLEPPTQLTPGERRFDGIQFWCNCDVCISHLDFGDRVLAVTYNLF